MVTIVLIIDDESKEAIDAENDDETELIVAKSDDESDVIDDSNELVAALSDAVTDAGVANPVPPSILITPDIDNVVPSHASLSFNEN